MLNILTDLANTQLQTKTYDLKNVENTPPSFKYDINIKRGYIKNPVTRQWEKLSNTAEPSPILVSRFISYLSSILNQNTNPIIAIIHFLLFPFSS